MAKSTSDYYKENPDRNRTRLRQQSRYQKTKKGSGIKERANDLNRKLGTYGNGDGLDASHYKGSKTRGRLQKASINRKSRLKPRKREDIIRKGRGGTTWTTQSMKINKGRK